MERILVADDDADILQLVKIILKSAGYQVHVIHTVERIEQEITNFKPDVILLDISMPPYDNRELCKMLKQEQKIDIPVLLFSANKIEDDSLIACKADGFMAKPFEINHLVTFVKNAASRK